MEADDATVGGWALDFVVRNPFAESNLIGKVLSAIPRSDFDSHLKKAFLVKFLQHYLSTVSIGEVILHILEMLEEFHRADGSPVTAAMRAAYCAVAVECTLKYLQVEVDKNPFYSRAVEKIWRYKVSRMKSSGCCEGSFMYSEELKQWKSDIETSLSDSQVRERLASIDTRREAINKLRVYLAEALVGLGPFFPEVEASVHTDKVPATEHLEAQHQEREIQEINEAANEEVHLATTIEFQKIGECSSSRVQTLVKDSLLHSSEVNEETHFKKQSRDTDVPCPDVINNNEAAMMENDQASIPHSRVHRPSLTEKNSTYEWDDSIDGGTSNLERRFDLPRSKVRKISPSKKCEPTNITKRRKAKKWSQQEVETLKTAVDKFGRGNWKIILNSYRDIFEGRTEVDLKDKWRNLTRYGCN
ncbi:hypothetical protein Fmac_023076 [Flemingia macrophylla]|uniref:Telomeric repeat-binding factor n=1 Tax=Flemingia macrophylla TaxID=520843 RepID=A0ABD1LKZ9_9FABA